MNDKRCFLTLDYELFLGSNAGSVSKCLLEPTSQLLRVLNRYCIKATFFVDVAYLLRLKELKEKDSVLASDYIIVTEHIKSLASHGHSIQLHFHPQWLFSDFYNGKWVIDKSHYKIEDLERDYVKQTISEGIHLLESITQTTVKAFRAGGYTLNDFSLVHDIFKNEGISIDSSVLRGVNYQSEYQRYDYSTIPAYSSYRFEKDIKINASDGFFSEYPISTMPTSGFCSFFDKLIIKYSYRLKTNTQWGDGKSVVAVQNRENKINRIKKYFELSHRVASIDGVKSIWLSKVFAYSARYGNDFVIMGHPKLITPFSLKMFESFIVKNLDQVKFDLL